MDSIGYCWSVYMSSPSSGSSPLARLVLFMVCLSIAGSIAAGVHWFVIDAPQQNALQPPTNSDGCSDVCRMQSTDCAESCPMDGNWETCVDDCTNAYYSCTCIYCKLYC
ncbi:MAG: hypothetical protein WC379_08890 [Methanoregula sp.]